MAGIQHSLRQSFGRALGQRHLDDDGRSLTGHQP